MEPVGVFGGSFDPPHIGHLIVAEIATETLGLEKVLWVPNRLPPHKAYSAASPFHRERMVSLAITDNPKFELSRVELERSGPSFMVDTLGLLQEVVEAELVLILGSDAYAGFGEWRAPEQIRKLARLAVYPRAGFDIAHLNVDAGATLVRAPTLDLSSTAIRDRLARAQSVRYQVPDAVLTYISTHRLYAP